MKLFLALILFIALSILKETDSAHLKQGNRKASGLTIVDTIEKYLREINDIVEDSNDRTSTVDLNKVLDERRDSHITPVVVDEQYCKENDCENGGSDMKIYTNPSGKRAVGNDSLFWPDNEIYYDFADGGNFTSSRMSEIESFIEHFNNQVCDKIKWKKLEAGDSRYHVKIINEDGCWSYVGYLGDEPFFKFQGFQSLSLQAPVGNEAHCIYRGTTQHEMMHAMGFTHEQNRADRDDYVKINFTNIINGTEGNFDIIDGVHEKALSHNKSRYDHESLMHYRSRDFSKNGQRTIVALINGTEDIDEAKTLILGQADDLSYEDLRELLHLYQCDASTTTTQPTTTQSTTTQSTTTQSMTTESTTTDSSTTESSTTDSTTTESTTTESTTTQSMTTESTTTDSSTTESSTTDSTTTESTTTESTTTESMTTESTTTESTTTDSSTTESMTTDLATTDSGTTEAPSAGCEYCKVLNGFIPEGFAGFTFGTSSSCRNLNGCNTQAELPAESTTGLYCFEFYLSNESTRRTSTVVHFTFPNFDGLRFRRRIVFKEETFYQFILRYAGEHLTVHVSVVRSNKPVVFHDVVATSC